MDNSRPKQSHMAFQSLMSCAESNQENFNLLVRLMRRNVVIPFIGAGFSANFGYPTWRDFLNKQASNHYLTEIELTKNLHDYEKKATLLSKHLGGYMEVALMQSFGDHVYKEHSYDKELDWLPKIFRNLILTTNYDEVIEMLYAKVNGEYIAKLTPRTLGDVKLSHKRIACGEPTLIKLHGDVGLREFVLTEQSYNSIYGEQILDIRLPIPSFLRDILLSRVILFLGCSLEDDRTLRVIEQSQIDGSISFALLELPEKTKNTDNPWKPKIIEELDGKDVENLAFAERKAFLYTHNIIPIWFPYEEYDALKIFLTELASQSYTEYSLSITRAQSQVADLLDEGDKQKKCNDDEQAFRYYTKALEIIKTNPEAFVGKERLVILRRIKLFYDLNGYGFECTELINDIIDLVRRIYSDISIELAMCYHDIGYTYEKYLYYPLMLKTMQRSQEILQKCEEKTRKDDSVLNAAAYIYTGLAYAFLKNGNTEKSKEWYQKAENLLYNYEQHLFKDEKSFIYNGLYRYYQIIGDKTATIDTLDKALKLRRELYYEGNLTDDKARDILNHIINTHSNKISIYLADGQYEKAEKEFQVVKHEYQIWNKTGYLRDAKRRILTDHGDILMSIEKFDLAYDEYKKALQYRKYLHFTDDFLAAKIYLKIANNLINIPDRHEEAMEYMIQAYVVYEKFLTTNHPDVREIRENYMEELRECLSYSNETLEQRLSVQKEFLQHRHDERMDNQQDELIGYFGL